MRGSVAGTTRMPVIVIPSALADEFAKSGVRIRQREAWIATGGLSAGVLGSKPVARSAPAASCATSSSQSRCSRRSCSSHCLRKSKSRGSMPGGGFSEPHQES
jgi:hypothetical protein